MRTSTSKTSFSTYSPNSWVLSYKLRDIAYFNNNNNNITKLLEFYLFLLNRFARSSGLQTQLRNRRVVGSNPHQIDC